MVREYFKNTWVVAIEKYKVAYLFEKNIRISTLFRCILLLSYCISYIQKYVCLK